MKQKAVMESSHLNAVDNWDVTEMLKPNEFLDELEREHREWLSSFDERYLIRFENVKNGSYEAAMTEAAVRRLLHRHGVSVKPNEDLDGSSQQPDFLCSQSGQSFFVEVTCIAIEKVVAETHLPYPTESGASHYSMLNDSFWSACKGKAKQCGGQNHPTLVAVGTFHTSASVLCVSKPHVEMLLTGETRIAWNIDTRTGSQVGDTYLNTQLYSAAFLRPDPNSEVGFARGSISGLLVCGLGVEPPKVLGVLHPQPARSFDPSLLAGVEFGEVEIDRETQSLRVRWPTEDDN